MTSILMIFALKVTLLQILFNLLIFIIDNINNINISYLIAKVFFVKNPNKINFGFKKIILKIIKIKFLI